MARLRSTYDAVIVGGGHNGLVAAAYLARAGLSCLVLERRGKVGGAAVSERLFAGVDVRVSRYAYLVSLLPRRIVDELALPVRFVRRAVSSYTPDPRAGGARGLLVDAGDAAATQASFRAVGGDSAHFDAWQSFHAMVRTVARQVFPTLLQPLRRAPSCGASSPMTPRGRRSSRPRWLRPSARCSPTTSCAVWCSPMR